MRILNRGGGLTNLVCSIQSHFGVTPRHGTLDLADSLLSRGGDNVITLIYDGMGVNALDRHLSPGAYLRAHHMGAIYSTFPPTTTAATTTLLTGLTPAEHGWLGWNMYLPGYGIVTMFHNTLKGTATPAAAYDAPRAVFPYDSVASQIRAAGGQAYIVSPFAGEIAATLDAILYKTAELCQRPGKKYIYAYWTEPDAAMHEHGWDSPKTASVMREIDEKTCAFARGLTDALLIISADHGHTNVRYRFISDHPEIGALLKRGLACEPRAAMFFVNDGAHTQFARLFNERFGHNFILLDRRQMIERRLFGEGEPRDGLYGCLGDFIAIATGDECLADSPDDNIFASHHAGLTEDEMLVPFIAESIKTRTQRD